VKPLTSSVSSVYVQDRCGATPGLNGSDSFGAANSPFSPGIHSFTNRSAIGTLDAAAFSGHFPASPIAPCATVFDSIDANHDGQVTREEFDQAMMGMAASVPAMTLPATSTGMVVHRSMPAAVTIPATVGGLPSYTVGSEQTEFIGGSIQPGVEAMMGVTSSVPAMTVPTTSMGMVGLGMASSVPAMTLPATSTGMIGHSSMPAVAIPATVAGLSTNTPASGVTENVLLASSRTQNVSNSGSIQPVVEAKVLSTSVGESNLVTVASVPPPPLPMGMVRSSVIGAIQGSEIISTSAVSALPVSQVLEQSSITMAPLASSRVVTTSAAGASMVQSSRAHVASTVPAVTSVPPMAPVRLPVLPVTSLGVSQLSATSHRVSQVSSPLAAGMHMSATPPTASLQQSRSWNTQGTSIPAEEDAWFSVGSPSVRVEPTWRDGRWWLSAAVDFRGLEKLPLGSKQAILCVADEALEQMECQGSLPQLPAPASWDDRGCPIS